MTNRLLNRILKKAPPGTVIPKPHGGTFKVKGQGMRRGEDSVVYFIPNHREPTKPYEKGIRASELERAYDRLTKSGLLTHEWFRTHLPACEAEGSCNFTTVGGLLILLGVATYASRGAYRKAS